MNKILFYNQPIAHRFGKELNARIESREWERLEVAVAWVMRSGTRHIKPYLQRFLSDGGIARFTVGVDIENTSKEGLEDLLDLQDAGDAETYIYHNEANAIFHPKVYLLQNEKRSCLIVGSNNITESGLFVNTEAGLQIEARSNDSVILEARTALASWRDETSGLVKKLDMILLNDLVALGYVLPEATLRHRRSASEAAPMLKRRGLHRALFTRLKITIPPPLLSPIAPIPVLGTVLLMRVRRASETSRRTQVQIPIRVLRTQFFKGMHELVSAHDGRSHSIITALARGGVNTKKVELPEIDPMADPVIRLERTESTIIYQTFDASSVLGRPIMDALKRGREFSPPVTFLTTPGNPAKATWWRFV